MKLFNTDKSSISVQLLNRYALYKIAQKGILEKLE